MALIMNFIHNENLMDGYRLDHGFRKEYRADNISQQRTKASKDMHVKLQ